MHCRVVLAGWCSCLATALTACAGDWPMWRYDAGRTAASPHDLPAKLGLLWARHESPREPVWDDPLNQDLMPYDKQFEPVVVGQRLFLGFNDSDKVVAIDTHSGRTLWSFYANGPVRFPPVATAERVYFTSDDGYLYCVAAGDGKLVWKHRGGPTDRRILGNKRIISTWPARGGPVLAGDTVYYAASIWPFMGTFIYALDAQSGRERWVNDSSGSTYIDQPHNSPAFAGVAPQGAMAVCGDVLLVPGGRSIPAAFDCKTGKQLYFHLAKNNKTGGSSVFAAGDYFFAHERAGDFSVFDLAKGNKFFENKLQQPVVTSKVFYTAGAAVRAVATTDLKKVPPPKEDSKTKGKKDSERRKGKRRAADDDDDDDPDPDEEKKKADEEAKAKEKDPTKNGKKNNDKKKDDERKDDKKKPVEGHHWIVVADASGDLIKAGRRLYAGGKKGITILEEAEDRKSAREVGQIPVDGPVVRLVAADDKLFAVTASGTLLAFGDGATNPAKLIRRGMANVEPIAPAVAGQAKAILDVAGVREGYGVLYGCGDADFAAALAHNSQLQLTLVEPDQAVAERLRRRLDALEVYGRQVAVLEASPQTASMPPYLSSLTIVAPAAHSLLDDQGFIKALFESLRPYSGKALLVLPAERVSDMARRIAGLGFAGAQVTTHSAGLMIERAGPLPGSATWTHQYGDVANTIKSDDLCVKLPLGLLWFGGNSNMEVLPRHGHGPSPQVVGGRLFVEGMDSLSARDVYTGRVLWTVKMPNLANYGIYYDETYKDTPLLTAYNQVHIPGANGRGTNFVVTEDRVYVLEGPQCRVLDPATGATLGMFSIRALAAGATKILAPNPPEPDDDAGETKKDPKKDSKKDDKKDGKKDPSKKDDKSPDKEKDKPADKPVEKFVERNRVDDWAYLGVFDKHLIGGAGFAHFPRDNTRPPKRDARSRWRYTEYDVSASRALVGMDRFTGREKWRIEARHGFLHNAIAAGNGMLFCLDKLPPGLEQKLKRRGKTPPKTSRLLAIDLATGDVRWETSQHIFGSWLGYLDERKMLLQATRPSRDMLTGEEGSRLIAYDAATGKVLWDKAHKYDSPPILHRQWIIAGGKAYDQKTGEPVMRDDPLTGKKAPWSYSRAYGCNYPIASEHMLVFRSAAAGFFDLATDGGTGNFGGFKSSCSANLIAADGVLSAPDYTRTCTCSYQNQTSLALVHMPEVEMWTNNDLTFRGGVIRRLGLNFGAAGDRRAADGTLWLEHPNRAGTSPKVPVEIKGTPEYFQNSASRIAGSDYNWVAASGVKGAVDISVTLDSKGVEALASGIHIAASSDDAEEDAKGKVRLDSGDLELTEDATEQVVGLRYTHLEIPQGSKIDLAYIQFKADEPSKDTADLVIQAQASDDAATFANADKDVSKRPRTKAKVPWKVTPWEKAGDTGADQRSPSLISLIEEVVGRAGWQPDNSIAFVITGEGEHIARAFDSDPSGAPTLYVKLKGGKILTAASTAKPRKYNVQLLFAEPEDTAPGERVFDVLIQGKVVLNGFDIAALAGQRRLVSREFRDVAVNGKLNVSLRSNGKHRPILCGLKATAAEEAVTPAIGSVGGQP